MACQLWQYPCSPTHGSIRSQDPMVRHLRTRDPGLQLDRLPLERLRSHLSEDRLHRRQQRQRHAHLRLNRLDQSASSTQHYYRKHKHNFILRFPMGQLPGTHGASPCLQRRGPQQLHRLRRIRQAHLHRS